MAMPPELKILIKEMVDLAAKQQAQIRQLERDVEYLMTVAATHKNRFEAIGEAQRRLEAKKMYGVT